MKKKTIGLFFAVIFSVLTACGNDSSDNSSSIEPDKTEATPTEATVAEPTEAVAKEPTPTEAVVEEPTSAEVESNCIIDGVDFSKFVKYIDNEQDILAQCHFDETRLIFFDGKPYEKDGKTRYQDAPFEDGGYAILKNGETYHKMHKENRFSCFLYTSKQVEKALIDDRYLIYDKSRMDWNVLLYVGFFQMKPLGYEGGTVTYSIGIKYEDGTEETFTFTVTDQ